MSIKIAHIDTETGELDPKKSALLQIACIFEIIEDDKVIATEFQSYVQPPAGLEIAPEALAVNGITLEQIQTFPTEESVHREFVKFLQMSLNKYDTKDKAYFSGYNAGFDNAFIREFFLRNGDKYFGSYFWSGTLDVMCFALNHLRHIRCFMSNFKLGTVAFEILGETAVNAITSWYPLHDARSDAYLSREIFHKIEEEKFIARIEKRAEG